jgi:hypothetical protein
MYPGTLADLDQLTYIITSVTGLMTPWHESNVSNCCFKKKIHQDNLDLPTKNSVVIPTHTFREKTAVRLRMEQTP